MKEGTFTAVWNGEIYATREIISKTLKSRNAVLLDVRDFDEWKRESSSPYGIDFAPRKGRLEGAIHLLWKDLMKADDG